MLDHLDHSLSQLLSTLCPSTLQNSKTKLNLLCFYTLYSVLSTAPEHSITFVLVPLQTHISMLSLDLGTPYILLLLLGHSSFSFASGIIYQTSATLFKLPLQ